MAVIGIYSSAPCQLSQSESSSNKYVTAEGDLDATRVVLVK